MPIIKVVREADPKRPDGASGRCRGTTTLSMELIPTTLQPLERSSRRSGLPRKHPRPSAHLPERPFPRSWIRDGTVNDRLRRWQRSTLMGSNYTAADGITKTLTTTATAAASTHISSTSDTRNGRIQRREVADDGPGLTWTIDEQVIDSPSTTRRLWHRRVPRGDGLGHGHHVTFNNALTGQTGVRGAVGAGADGDGVDSDSRA